MPSATAEARAAGSGASAARAVVLIGLESSGKSALFRGLTGGAVGDEANFRGSTVACRRRRLADSTCELVDTPGVRVRDDCATTRLALSALAEADTVLLVARGTHAGPEVETLLRELGVAGRRAALVLTFADKAPPELPVLAGYYRRALGLPVFAVDARSISATRRCEILAAVEDAAVLGSPSGGEAAPTIATVQPSRTPFEGKRLAPWLALLCVAGLFAGPVWAAFTIAAWAQPRFETAILAPLVERLGGLPPLWHALLAGGHGLFTLGSYSLLWAFPVVVLIGLSVALGEETGLKDRITAALDPWLRRVGLAGRDLLPVLTGFGCNVVAVRQSRSCSRCTRRSCVSLIAFGSACSYQIGATLSVFAAGGHGWLFAPYLTALVLVGALHTRFWHGGLSRGGMRPLHERAFLQAPSWRAVAWRLRATAGQFLLQAMPVFLGICVVAALLAHSGVMDRLAAAAAPVLRVLGLPGEAAPGVLFAILRKDGLLVLNAGDGALLSALPAGQAFVLVWLSSTLTACLVTLATIARELGPRTALALAGRQAATALATTALLALALRAF